MAKKAKNNAIITADIARLMNFGGQQMRDLYFNSDVVDAKPQTCVIIDLSFQIVVHTRMPR